MAKNVFKEILLLTTVSLWSSGSCPVMSGDLPNEQHGISGTFGFSDTNTIYIENFNYDGLGPGAWFYYYSPNVSVTRLGGGYKILLPSQYGQSDGSLSYGTAFVNVNVTVTLPNGVDACDIGTFTIWCQPFNAIFTRIVIPRDIFGDGYNQMTTPSTPPEFDNCAIFHDKLQLSWRVRDSDMRFRLCGCQSTVSSINQYMGFGLSGSNTAVQMVGADVTIAWVDPTDGAQAVDYYLSAYTQCRDGEGACPDTLDSSGSCTNDVFDISGSVDDGVQCVSFTRNLSTSDSVCDKYINTSNSSQYIVWSVGAYGETAFKHFINAQPTDTPINFGRRPEDQCDGVDLVCESCSPYMNEKIVARENTTFDVTVGPSGNERGYTGITGRAGWGIAFFINGTMIPELTVERGKTYTFRIYGGDNPDQLSNYHPLYITDSIGGGRSRNTVQEKMSETVYAGFDEYDNVTSVGDLCQLSETSSSASTRETCSTNLNDYIDTLSMSSGCSSGQPGILKWTPDNNTNDTVYYQCATHLNLGWRINVVNESIDDSVEPTADTIINYENDSCIPLDDQLQLSWNVNRTLNEIRFQLCGCHSRTSEYNQYMGFGMSGSPSGIQMKGGDVTLAWVDDINGPMAVDYYLSAYSPCDTSTGRGACPDTLDSSGSCTNNVFNVEGFVTDGVQCVLYTRNLTLSDTVCDSDIDVNANQTVIWAIGQYTNNLPQYHSSMRVSNSFGPVHFGRSPENQCTGYTLNCQGCSPFVNNKINSSNGNATFEVTVGPSAYERGYTAITGVSKNSNVSFYINGSLIPELTISRGNTYTFLVSTGNDSSDSAHYYQFYITDSRYGGRLLNTSYVHDDSVYAGINEQGNYTAGGRLCQLKESRSSIYARESCNSLAVYVDTLSMSNGCGSGQPGILEWTPDNDTPDLVYYQSASHLTMGWRINIVDANTTNTNPTQAGTTYIPSNDENDSCIPLDDQLQLSWNINQTLNEIRFRLCGCHSRTSEYNQYMGFGISGSPSGISMTGGDVTLAWVDDTNGPMAVDYYLSAYSPCDTSTGRGACPDTLDASGSCTNNVFNVEGFVTNGVQCVLYTRNLTLSDTVCDSDININANQTVIWAIGQYTNNLPQYHSSMRVSNSFGPIHFGRSPEDQCTGYTLNCQGCSPFINNKINSSNVNATFEVTIGPSAYERGYTAITGQSKNSNVSFYINGTLIPELTISRGNTYTFLVSTGNDSSDSAHYYQFYITDSHYGGRLLNMSYEDSVYAGIDQQGIFTAGGRLCHLIESRSSIYARESCSSLAVYVDTLTMSNGCGSGQPGILEWTPDNDTPDLVYYQSANHLNMGWRINVIGSYDSASTTPMTLNNTTLPSVAAMSQFLAVLYSQSVAGITGVSIIVAVLPMIVYTLTDLMATIILL